MHLQQATELLRIRKTLRISAAALARRAGLDVKTIANVEQNRHRPRAFTLTLIWEGLRKEAERKRLAGADTSAWPRCTKCGDVLIADGQDCLCADCIDPAAAAIRRAVEVGEATRGNL